MACTYCGSRAGVRTVNVNGVDELACERCYNELYGATAKLKVNRECRQPLKH